MWNFNAIVLFPVYDISETFLNNYLISDNHIINSDLGLLVSWQEFLTDSPRLYDI